MNISESQKYINEVGDRRKKLILFIKFTLVPLAVIFLFLAVALLIDLIGVPRTVKLEAGDPLPSAESVCGRKGAEFVYDETVTDISKVGNYELLIKYGKGKTVKVKLEVVDTTAPTGKVKELSIHYAASVTPAAADFFEKISDASEYKASFAKKPDINGVGEYPVSIVLSDAYGNKSTYSTTLKVINDTEKPHIVATKIEGYVGEGIAYKNAVTVEDNCFGVTLEYDDSQVNINVAGEYVVTYIATDAAGNKTTAMVPVVIRKAPVSAEEINAIIAKIAAERGMTNSLSREELCRRIYEYVNDPTKNGEQARFQYIGHSNTDRSDWREEAKKTLESGQGDCYSYFALSKAFFEYFGIENRDVQRNKMIKNQTHFWNVVNIGTAQNPCWYYFDATRSAGSFSRGGNNGCLLTEAQLGSYEPSVTGYGDEYYSHDRISDIVIETRIINDRFTFN